MSVTNTISATESLDERIKFTEEEAAKLAATIAAAEVVRAAKTAMPKLLGVALLAVAFLCALMAYGSLIAAVDEKEELKTAGKALFWLMTGGFLAGTWLAGRRALALVSRPNVALNLTDEEARLAALRADIHRLKEQRRALLIAHSEDVLARDHVLTDSLEGKVGGDVKECPQCAEFVKARAKRCRHCGFDFPATIDAG